MIVLHQRQRQGIQTFGATRVKTYGRQIG